MNAPGAKLSADGLPLKSFKGEEPFDKLSGGSGGYIYVHTTNLHESNSIHPEATISATGGHGVGKAGAGSGGAIVLDGGLVLATQKIDASGGLSAECSHAAAGSIWIRHEDRLVIDNKDKVTVKYTLISAPKHLKRRGRPHFIAGIVDLEGRAQVRLSGQVRWMAFDDLHMRGQVTLALQRTKKAFNIQMRRDINLDAESTLDVSLVSQVVINSTETNTKTYLGNVIFRRIFGMRGKDIVFKGRLSIPERAPASAKRKSVILLKVDRHLVFHGSAKIVAA